jgi:hypothetical protein
MAPGSHCNEQFGRKRTSGSQSGAARRLKWRLVARLLGTGQYDPATNTAMVGAQMLFEIFSLMVLVPSFDRADG